MKKLLFSIVSVIIMTDSIFPNQINPIIAHADNPYNTIRFNEIKISDYKPAILEGIRIQNERIDSIISNPERATFENTIVALDRSGRELTRTILTLSNLEAALGSEELMEVMAEVTPIISDHSTGIMLNPLLWERVKNVYEQEMTRTDLEREDKRLISETYMDFVSSGANFNDSDKETYRRLQSELSDLTVKFGQNVSNEMKNPEKRLWLDSSQLKGLPADLIHAAREEAKNVLISEGKEDDGSYLFTMFQPSYGPFMKYQEDRSLREKMYKLYNSRNLGGKYDNSQILKDIANIRLEIAKLFGDSTYSQYKLKRTMAGTPDAVMKLLEDLRQAYMPAMENEIREIEIFARKTEGEDFKLQPWDYSFWSDKLKNDQYAFNDEDLKPYFELNKTIDGVFGLANSLYGYTFRENKNIPVYHPDVKAYEVIDSDGKIFGILYADFFYREGKSPGAWMTEFGAEEKDDNGNRTIPLISIVCNFSKPIGEKPVLLTAYEVETFLHEFGHALHGLSADTKYASLSGTNVYHDFVETFSQFNENYLMEKEFLDGFAVHYQTGEKMPAVLLENFIKSSQYGAAYACIRQLGFGFLDMAFYNRSLPLRASTDIVDFEKNAQLPVKIFEQSEDCATSPSFGHIFSGGYASGYYGYKWAEVLDADAFSAFKENGIFDKATADKFHEMLKSGGSEDPMILYENFRGRKPSIDALLKRDGILK